MGENRILLIESPSKLSLSLGRICIQRKDHEKAYVLPRDAAAIIVNHPEVTLTSGLLNHLADNNVFLLCTDDRHLPIGWLLPWGGHATPRDRFLEQLDLERDHSKKDELWRAIVQSRLRTQAHCLRQLGRKGALRLERMANDVFPGDKSNTEAHAARHYWKNIMPSSARREKRGATDPVNARLNYGYAVLRAMLARQLAVHGLNTSLGLHHRNNRTMFNLADDLMEPFRFIVERHVFRQGRCIALDGKEKVRLLEFIESEIEISGQNFRLLPSLDHTIGSFLRVLKDKSVSLALPGMKWQ